MVEHLVFGNWFVGFGVQVLGLRLEGLGGGGWGMRLSVWGVGWRPGQCEAPAGPCSLQALLSPPPAPASGLWLQGMPSRFMVLVLSVWFSVLSAEYSVFSNECLVSRLQVAGFRM